MKLLNLSSDTVEITRILTRDGVIVLPTDTVYGLAAQASSRMAVSKVFALKERDGKPGTIIAASVAQLRELGLNAHQLSVAASLWPNAVSVIIDADETLSHIHFGLGSIACRIPKQTALQALLEQTGPLLTSSANKTGHPVVDSVQSAAQLFGDSVDGYVDGGVLGNVASTIVRIENDTMTLIRQGDVRIDL